MKRGAATTGVLKSQTGEPVAGRWWIATLLLSSTGLFLANSQLGYLRSVEALARELESPAGAPESWMIGTWDAIKYRVLFRLVVQSSWQVLPWHSSKSFYYTYLAWSYACFVTTTLLLYRVLRAAGYPSRDAYLGTILGLTSPPLLFAYLNPVHTREDLLSYVFVGAAFLLALDRREVCLSVVLAMGVLCRETVAVVGLGYLVWSNRPWVARVSVLLPAALAIVAVRIVVGPNAGSGSLNGFWFNLEHPGQSFGFLFLIFGWMWIPAMAVWWSRRNDRADRPSSFIVASFPVVLLAILLAHVGLGRLREIRISFIVFPWVLVLAVDWVRTHPRWLALAWGNRTARLSALGMGVALGVAWKLAVPRWPHWGLMLGIHSALAVLCLHALYNDRPRSMTGRAA